MNSTARTERTRLVIRGLRVCAVGCQRNERDQLSRQFFRLGVDVTFTDALPPPASATETDLILFDSDNRQLFPPRVAPKWPDGVPRLALLGSETPSRLKWVAAQQVSSYLIKPIRHSGVYSALYMALSQHALRQQETQARAALEVRIAARRALFQTQLAVMRHFGIDEGAAYGVLRRMAMTRRLSVEEIGREGAEDMEALMIALRAHLE